VTLLILRGHKHSLQNSLNKFFSGIGKVFRVPTSSALCQARQKIKPEVFQCLNESTCDDFYSLYEKDGLVRRWWGKRLLACDGTFLNLPDNEQTRKEFFLQTNQYKNGAAVQALSCVLYDLLNGLVLSATLGTRTGEQIPLVEQLWEKTQAGDILILDRRYADFKVLASAVASRRDVVIRLPKNSFKEARPLFIKEESGLKEKVVELKCQPRARKYAREHGLPESVRVRFIRVELKDGEVEVLVTTFLDKEQYPASEFKELYGMRWGEETIIGRVKNIFEAERFSGTSPLAIKQDYYGVLFLATLESVLAVPDQRALMEKMRQQQERREARTIEDKAEEDIQSGREEKVVVGQPQVNHAVSYIALLDRVVDLLMGKRSEENILKELHHLFRTSPTRVRPGRDFERKPERKHMAKRLRWHKYGKKIIA
jgi:hypothetical protein